MLAEVRQKKADQQAAKEAEKAKQLQEDERKTDMARMIKESEKRTMSHQKSVLIDEGKLTRAHIDKAVANNEEALDQTHLVGFEDGVNAEIVGSIASLCHRLGPVPQGCKETEHK